MRNRRSGALTLLLGAIAAFTGCAHVAAQSGGSYGLGRPADPAAIARIDIDVSPDGTGLPDGRGDAEDGAAIFASSCQRCHGAMLALDAKRWPYATTIFDYIRRAMPPHRTSRLSARDVYALSAFLLGAKGLVGRHDILDRMTLPRVRMPGVGDFIEHP